MGGPPTPVAARADTRNARHRTVPDSRPLSSRFYGLDKHLRFREAVRHLGNPGRLLDVGGGTGDFFDFSGMNGIVADMAGGRSLFGAVRSTHQRVTFDGMHLPFRSRAFETVLCLDTLEHMREDVRPAFIAELLRVAGKSVILTFPEKHVFLPVVLAIADLYNRLGITPILKRSMAEHMTYGLPLWDNLMGTVDSRDWTASVLRFFGTFASIVWILQLFLPFLATTPFNIAFSRLCVARQNGIGSQVLVVARRKGSPADLDAPPPKGTDGRV